MSFVKRVFLLVAVLAGAAWAEVPPLSRYQSIIDRQMFGALPVGFDPTKLPSEVSKSAQKELTKEQEQLKSAIRFSVINQTPDGQVAVGFTDNSDPKNPCHYYLKVGETRGGWLVTEADPTNASMTIVKGEIEVSLTIGGDSAKDAGATAKAGAAKPNDGVMTLEERSGRSPLLRTLGSRRFARAAEAKQREAERLKEQETQRREREEERQAREAEREEQRNQLLAIQSELKAMREKKQAAAEQEAEKETEGHENNDAE